jgi:hypothetical protein
MVSQELLLNFPESDRLLITEEAMADPAFGEQLSQVLSQEGGVKAVALCMRHAVVNEMNPRLYPESKGMWPVLRKTVVAVAKSMPEIVEKELARLPLETLTEMLKMVAEGKSPFSVAVSGMGAGEFGWGSLFGSLIEAGAGIFEKKLAGATAVKIEGIKAGGAAATMDAQARIAEAQKAIAEAQAASAPTAANILSADIGMGVPFWAVAVPAILIAGVSIYFVVKKKR